MDKIKEIIEKYKIPSLDKLFGEFGKFDPEEEEDFIELIIKKISGKVNNYIKFLEDILQPDSSLIVMHESSMFDNDERKKLFSILKELIYIDRLSLKIDLSNNYEDKVNYFKEYYYLWINKKDSLLPIIEKSISVWKKDNEDNEFEGYFG